MSGRMFKSSFQSLLLRVPTVLGRFLLVPLLARHLPVEDVGVYGLMAVAVPFCLTALGLDFYVFNTRELLRREPAARPQLLRDQAVLHGAAYALLLPCAAGLFLGGLLPGSVAPWFFALLVAEHVSTECQRVLFTLSRPVAANAVMAVRSGGWAVVVVVALEWFPATRSLSTVWVAWLGGAGVSLALCLVALRDLPWRTGVRAPVDFAWIRRGLLTGLPFLVSTLSFRGIFTLDRFVLQHGWGEAGVGVYSLFFGIANSVPVFAETAFIMILFPQMVDAAQRNDEPRYREAARHMALGVAATTLGLCALLALAIAPILDLVGRPVYAEALPVFWVLLGVGAVTAVGYLPHYALYARHRDREIVLSTLAGLCVALVANVLLVGRLGPLGAALATLAAMTTVGGCKALAAAGQRAPLPAPQEVPSR